jgi:hypothetical protein
MTPYLDGGFLLTLLAKTPGSPIASELLRNAPTPISINLLHQLQAENLLIRMQRDADLKKQAGGNQGHRLWRQYLDEGVFALTETDWSSALRNAITWNRITPELPPNPWLFLHPALAFANGATHFFSFDPRPRNLVRGRGMALVPEEL